MDKLNTIFFEAAKNGYYNRVKKCIEAGANIKAKDIFGETALHKASKFGYKDLARLLQNAGAK